MSERTDIKRAHILAGAREVFLKKGFRSVTMKDIADAAGISRGGLYLYYRSTEEIFLDVLKQEESEEDTGFEKRLSSTRNAKEMLALVLAEQKKELLAEGDLTEASYELAFSGSESGRAALTERFEKAAEVMKYLLRRGIRSGEFRRTDPEETARQIMLIIEGLRIGTRTMQVTEEMIDEQLRRIMQQLLSED